MANFLADQARLEEMADAAKLDLPKAARDPQAHTNVAPLIRQCSGPKSRLSAELGISALRKSG